MDEKLAAKPASVWNRKNLPTNVEPVEDTGKVEEIIKQLPAAATTLVRRNRGTVMLALGVLGVIGLFWFLNKKD